MSKNEWVTNGWKFLHDEGSTAIRREVIMFRLREGTVSYNGNGWSWWVGEYREGNPESICTHGPNAARRLDCDNCDTMQAAMEEVNAYFC